MTREIARRFNHLYGREPGFEAKALEAARKMGGRPSKQYLEYRTRFQEQGDRDALAAGRALIDEAKSLSSLDRERVLGYLEGSSRTILVEPAAVLTETPKIPGLDGQKMSKSLGNTILMRDDPKALTEKIRRMPTDPARVRRTDPGEPERCPVWQLHLLYSDAGTRDWVQKGCRSAGIGCLECKQPVIDAVLAEQKPWRERAQPYLDNPKQLHEIVGDGCARARRVAQATMRDVRQAMGLDYT
jgi:tryptophanyl-tRNA synthetase